MERARESWRTGAETKCLNVFANMVSALSSSQPKNGKQDRMPETLWIGEKHTKFKKNKSPPAGKVLKLFVVTALVVGGGGGSDSANNPKHETRQP